MSVLIVVDSATVVSSSVVIGLVRVVGGEEVIVAEVVDIQQVLESAVVLAAGAGGRNGLMYISLVVPVGRRDVPGVGGRDVPGGGGEVGSGGSGFILEMSLVVGWLLVVEVLNGCWVLNMDNVVALTRMAREVSRMA